MDDRIEFFLWAPTRNVFVKTITAIKNPLTGAPLVTVDATTGMLTPSAGVLLDEVGIIAKTQPSFDETGTHIVTPGVDVNGYHANMATYGELSAFMRAGMPATGAVFETTRILQFLGQMTDAIAKDNLPKAKVGTSGVKLIDPADVNSRSRTWA